MQKLVTTNHSRQLFCSSIHPFNKRSYYVPSPMLGCAGEDRDSFRASWSKEKGRLDTKNHKSRHNGITGRLIQGPDEGDVTLWGN